MALRDVPTTTAYQKLNTGDSTKVILAGVAGQVIHVVKMIITSTVPAAQTVRLRTTTGLTEVFKLGASLPVGTYRGIEDFTLPSGEGLQADPAAAGPEIGFFIVYQIVPA